MPPLPVARGPLPRARLIALAVSPILLSACAQGTMTLSPSTILNAVVLAGEAMGARGGSSTTTRGGGGGGSSGANNPRSPAPSSAAARLLNTAQKYVGTPYTWGGNTPETGFDCSGFTKYVFAKQGIALPRTSREQAHAGRAVAVDFGAMIPGDLMFFAEPNEEISHVAIYAGDGQLIQSSSANHGVGWLDLRGAYSGWYTQNLVAVRRVL